MLKTDMSKKPRYPQQELAERLRSAMEESEVSLAEMSRACGVTIQAVHDWRETGRIGKQHLVTICRLTKKPFEYFLVGLQRAAVVVLAVGLLPYPSDTQAHDLSSSAAPAYYVKWLWQRFVLLPGYAAQAYRALRSSIYPAVSISQMTGTCQAA